MQRSLYHSFGQILEIREEGPLLELVTPTKRSVCILASFPGLGLERGYLYTNYSISKAV